MDVPGIAPAGSLPSPCGPGLCWPAAPFSVKSSQLKTRETDRHYEGLAPSIPRAASGFLARSWRHWTPVCWRRALRESGRLLGSVETWRWLSFLNLTLLCVCWPLPTSPGSVPGNAYRVPTGKPPQAAQLAQWLNCNPPADAGVASPDCCCRPSAG